MDKEHEKAESGELTHIQSNDRLSKDGQSYLVSRLIDANENSVQSANGSNIFYCAAKKIIELEAELFRLTQPTIDMEFYRWLEVNHKDIIHDLAPKDYLMQGFQAGRTMLKEPYR